MNRNRQLEIALLATIAVAGLAIGIAFAWRSDAAAERARSEKWIRNYQNAFGELEQVRAAHASSIRVEARKGYVFIVTGPQSNPQVVREYVPADGEIYRELRDALVDKE